MSSVLRGLRAQCDTTIDLARKSLLSSQKENCLVEALEIYEAQIDTIWNELEKCVESMRSERLDKIKKSCDRQKILSDEIERMEKMICSQKTDCNDLINRMDRLLEEEAEDGDDDNPDEEIITSDQSDRISMIADLKSTLRRQLNELDSVLEV